MQTIERWSGHLIERKIEKPRRECGHRHRRCWIKATGSHCCCGSRGAKFYRVPFCRARAAIDGWYNDTSLYLEKELTARQLSAVWHDRILGTARKWGRKRAWRMLSKLENKFGKMEYV
jgi:hypothetical protein